MNKKVAILATDGFEESELFEPKNALETAGAEVDVVSFDLGQIKSWKDGDWGAGIQVDKELGEVLASEYDALVLPGGVINADKLRGNDEAVDFVKAFVQSSKPIAAICHAPWILIEAGLEGRILTSYPSLKSDLRNAGFQWVDKEVVVDEGLVTSRRPADIPAFSAELIKLLGTEARPLNRSKSENAHRDLLN